MTQKQDGAENRLMPPYVSFQSVKTALAQFKEHVVPDRIDRSVLSNFSGAVGGQILTALRFLNLTDNSGHSTDLLRTLVQAYGTDAWPNALADVLRKAYGPIFSLNLTSCSPGQFMEKFKASYQGAEDVIRKSVTFFLNAANEAQIPISNFIMKARKPRSAPTKRKASKPAPQSTKNNENRKNIDVDDDDADDQDDDDEVLAPGMAELLLKKFPDFNPEWSAEVQAKWFEAFDRFMASVENKSAKK